MPIDPFAWVLDEPFISTWELAACGKPGYRAVTSEGRTRSRAAVVTTDAESIRDNARNQTLLRAMDSGRG